MEENTTPKFYILQNYAPLSPSKNEDGCTNLFYLKYNDTDQYINDYLKATRFNTIGEAMQEAAKLIGKRMYFKVIPIFIEN